MKKEQAEIFSANMSIVGGVLKTKTHELSLDEVYESSCDNLKMIAAKTGKGKSTLMLERALDDSKNGKNVLFITQEPIQNITKKIKDSTITDSVEKMNFQVAVVDLEIEKEDVVNIISDLENDGVHVEEVYVDGIRDLGALFEIDKNFTVSVQLPAN